MAPTDIFQCTPISYTWTGWSGATEGHCLNIYIQAWISGILNILLDIFVILLPIPHLLKLTMSRKKKAQVVAMFSVGLCVTLTSVARLTSLVRFRKTWNFTRDYTGISYMSTLEVDIGIICACMPAIQLLLRRVAPGILGSSITESSQLYPHTGSHARTKSTRHPSSHITQSKSITMTITTTVADMPKDSDSVIELVDTERQVHNSNGDCGSSATVSTEHYPHRLEW
ncbi:uncharacterized protein A1O9_10437 [Exophiala aquamarina CBS 119918]|uniref:Rhodopsin domain-containing protein n=1 Tax=Exophiala aquamarina CBS 119918 TaxID=1182545 RepID=A0A072P1B0_9EURO|nr:uncharacterized protein A1O9_10437 [Exophiala aquamarina CBS 119918]KEF53462.1 hypothetical protein A1O9_10437 [Exophiala aquamarina CBS 119918]